MEESRWKEFLGVFPVVKEINAIRKKGIILEEAFSWLTEQSILTQHKGYFPTENNTVQYHEMYFGGEFNGFIPIRIAWASARMGIPTLTVATTSKKNWILIKSMLQEKGFVR